METEILKEENWNFQAIKFWKQDKWSDPHDFRWETEAVEDELNK